MLSEVRAHIAQFTPEGTMKQANKTMLLTAALLLAGASANAEKPKKGGAATPDSWRLSKRSGASSL